MAIQSFGGEIYKDTNVYGASVYAGNGGQGCETVWFRTVARACAVVKELGKVPSGRDAGLCSGCQNHFRYGSEAWKRATPYACKAYKAQIAGCSQD